MEVISKTAEDTDSSNEWEDIEDNENRLSDEEEYPISEGSDVASEESDLEEEDLEKKTGWANSMAKILNSGQTEVLAKAKKVEDVEKKKNKKTYTFEIQGAEGEIKKEENEEKPSEDALKIALERRKRKEKREVQIL